MTSFQLMERLPSYLVPFFSLSYPTDKPPNLDSFHNSVYYNTGPLDACLIITCIAVMAVLRDAGRLGILEPFARWKLMRDLEERRIRRANGKPNGKVYGVANGNGHAVHANGDVYQAPATELRLVHRSVLRFAEQGWSVTYYVVQWCFGLYVHRNLPTKVLDPIDIWINYPHIPLAAPLKFYYLTQTAFYLHQVLILNAEARRKDHIQMMTHHVITIALMALSYFFNFTRVGCLIMVLMDWCDIFLPMAKMFRYLSLSTLCDLTFTWFLLSWFITRHVLFNIAIWSLYTEANSFIPFIWDPEQGRYWTRGTWISFVSMLVSLQVLQIIWFWTICRVAWRVISGQGAQDDRSDASDYEEDAKKDS